MLTGAWEGGGCGPVMHSRTVSTLPSDSREGGVSSDEPWSVLHITSLTSASPPACVG